MIVSEKTHKHGELLFWGNGGLGGPVWLVRSQPMKVILSEGDRGGGKVEDQRMSVERGGSVGNIKKSQM